MDSGSPKGWPSNLHPDDEFDFSALLDNCIALSTTWALENQEGARASIMALAPSNYISELQIMAKNLNFSLLDTTDFLQLGYGATGSSESIYVLTPTGSISTSSVYLSLTDFENLVLPPVLLCLPQPWSLQAFITQHPQQYPLLMPSVSVPCRSMTGKILHPPQSPQPPVGRDCLEFCTKTHQHCDALLRSNFTWFSKNFLSKGHYRCSC